VNGLAQAAAPAATGPALDNKRVAAALIDLLVLFGVGFLLGVLGGGGVTGPSGLLAVAWTLYYYFACESLTGQTLGKKAMGLRVANVDGSPPEMRQIAVRSVLRLIDGWGLYLVGLITMLASGQRRQRLGDLAAKTIVTTADDQDHATASDDASVVAFPAEPEPLPVPPGPPSPPPPPPPAAKEPPPFEPYRVPDEPAAPPPVPPATAPIQSVPQPAEPYSPAEEPPLELVPDPPAEGDEARIKIVSPMDVVMGEKDDDEAPEPPQSA
jgi:uncharacterized RDD family membrane protein YckC